MESVNKIFKQPLQILCKYYKLLLKNYLRIFLSLKKIYLFCFLYHSTGTSNHGTMTSITWGIGGRGKF